MSSYSLCCRSTNPAINPLNPADVANLVPFWVIGTDDGFVANLQPATTTLQMGPADRYDVIIDFSRESLMSHGMCDL